MWEIFTVTEGAWECHKKLVQQKMESVGYRYSCGDLLFGDGPMSKVIIQSRVSHVSQKLSLHITILRKLLSVQH